MEGTGETECSRTTNYEKIVIDEDESEMKNKLKDGGSSSNSTVEESENKPSVRPYIRSKMPRLRWTHDLHLRFINAVERLGGQERATPKLVLQLMNIKGLNITHIKSHLQMYRSKRIVEPYQGLVDQRLFMEGVDRNVYNLSQLPLLPSFNQVNHSNFRSGGASWNKHGRWNNHTTQESYGTDTKRILGNHYYRSSNLDFCSKINSSFNEGSNLRDKHGSMNKQESWLGQSKQNPIELQRAHEEQANSSDLDHLGQKRKALDFELDLNLSVGIESRNERGQEDDETLSLSLYTTPYNSKLFKKMKEDFASEIARGTSTLDLTL
ncbi:hypothetical protein ACJIZ3_019009 [Penstemon smallii]|uniref:HTH myb-type domain-containing protein n=1 Tax=Penstemon smallii TaxID=265156 RepID=A0ABD3SZY8_9LAMI